MKRLLPLLFILALPLLASAFTGWRPNPRNPNQVDKIVNDRQVGAWFKGDGYYRIEGDRWIKEGDDGPIENFGIDQEKLDQCHMRQLEGRFLTSKGKTREISVAEAKDIIEKGLPDDRLKPWIVAPGFAPETEKRIQADFAASPQAATHRLWTGPADHWHMQDTADKRPLGYIPGEVWLVAHDGEVLARAKDYKGPGDFAALEAIRRPKPVDPDKIPDARNPVKPSPIVDPAKPQTWPPQLWAIIGVVGVIAAAFVLNKINAR